MRLGVLLLLPDLDYSLVFFLPAWTSSWVAKVMEKPANKPQECEQDSGTRNGEQVKINCCLFQMLNYSCLSFSLLNTLGLACQLGALCVAGVLNVFFSCS